MKIGTITFHWVANYGAVLQSFALQKVLVKMGVNTEIIDYRPRKILISNRLSNLKHGNISSLKKEFNINKFRKRELILSKNKYWSYDQLKKIKNEYKGVIVGSDQIWNEWFTLHGEGKITKSYFLDFLPNKVKKFSYAASFGCESTTPEYNSVVKSSLSSFDRISVRENTGIDIISEFGLNSELVCDPTLLLKVNEYEKLIKNNKKNCNIFPYIINGNQQNAIDIYNYLKNKYSDCTKNYKFDFGIYEWLQYIHDSKFVVTNSFHGVVFCLLFNTDFIPVLIKGSGMNDRIITLLKMVNLEDRILTEFDNNKVDMIYGKRINWENVNKKIDDFRNKSLDFLNECIQEIE